MTMMASSLDGATASVAAAGSDREDYEQHHDNGLKEKASSVDSSRSSSSAAVSARRMAPPLSPGALVRLCGTNWTECGYCRGQRAHLVQRPHDASSQACSVLVQQLLAPTLYEQMLVRGWRRSGPAIYQPRNENSCCPCYTIRLPTSSFTPSKTQRKLQRQLQNLLLGRSGRRISPSSAASVAETTSSRQQRLAMLQQTLQSSGLLSQLSSETQSIVQSLLPQPVPDAVQQRWQTLLPLRFRIQASSSQRHTPSDRSDRVVITLISTVCAALAGPSQGAIHRGELATRVVERLRQSTSRWSSNDHGVPPRNARIVQVLRHVTSGQLLIDVELQPQEEGDVEMRDVHGGGHDDDKLATWWQHHCAPALPRPVPPYQLHITTLSAHDSALDPRVHQLYWHYQAKLHEDDDPRDMPFDDDDDDDDSSSDDTAAAEHAHQPGGKHNASSTTLAASRKLLQQAWLSHAPSPEWAHQAQHMLESLYGHLPMKRQEAIHQSFGLFCEFLVQNPFANGWHTIDDDQHTSNGYSNGRGRHDHDSNELFRARDKSNFHHVIHRRLSPGCYHQHYTIGDLLVAVGVVDVLPHGLSSVYVFYHPGFAHELVALGHIASLAEIAYARDILHVPYYYMGYYIHDCSKMKYKADYKPSQLQCPVTHQWVDAAAAQHIIDATSPEHHYCALVPRNVDLAGRSHSNASIQRAMTALRLKVGSADDDDDENRLLTLGMLTPAGQRLVQVLLEDFVRAVEPDLATQFEVDFS